MATVAHDPQSTVPVQIRSQQPEQSTLLRKNARPNHTNLVWLKKSPLSQSMQLHRTPGATAEDQDISSLRTFRYLKLDTSSGIDLPRPQKFCQSSKLPSRLTRSQSAYDCSVEIESSPSSACFSSGLFDKTIHSNLNESSL
jgi:hypothetical protein